MLAPSEWVFATGGSFTFPQAACAPEVLRDALPALGLCMGMTLMAGVFFAICIDYAEGALSSNS